ncbi:MAG: spore germination protein [Desulfotomaculales bacterium]
MRKRGIRKMATAIRRTGRARAMKPEQVPPGPPKEAQRETGRPDPSRLPAFEKDDLERLPVDPHLEVNIRRLGSLLGVSSDLGIRRFRIGGVVPAAAVFLKGMINWRLVAAHLLEPLMLQYKPEDRGQMPDLDELVRSVITINAVAECTDLHGVVDRLLDGSVILLVDGETKALAFDATGFGKRSPEEPMTEAVVRGPREGFIESLAANLTLLRRRLKTPNLVLESVIAGRVAHTQVTVAYVRGLAAPELVDEVKKRLGRIDIDGVLESNYLEELIRDHPLSPFPQAIVTERPDRVAAALLEGRVALLMENTPFVLIVPGEFVAHMQSAEDYYHHFTLGPW